MGFGEKILHKVAEAFSHQTSEQHAPNDAVFVATPVNPEDILKRGHWKNNRGATLRINVERGVMYDYASKEESLVDLVDTESIRKKLTEGGYVFVPATAEVLPETQEKPVPEVLEQPLPEITEKERGVVVQDDEALEQLLEGLDARVELIKTALDEAQEIVDAGHFQPMQSIIDEIASRVTVAVETANSLSQADDTANELAAKEGTLDEGYATAKQARLEKLKALSEEITLLEEHASMAIKSLKKLHGQAVNGALDDTMMGARGKDADVRGEGTRSKKKKGERPPRGGRRGGDGGDGTGEDDEDGRSSGKGQSTPVDRTGQRAAKREGNLAALLQGEKQPIPSVNPDTVVPPAELVSGSDQEREREIAALEAFLERPEGREVIDTYRMIITGEWEKYTQALERSKSRISREKARVLWQQDERLLPTLSESIQGDLVQKRLVTPEQAQDIFRCILNDLDEEFVAQQGSRTPRH